MGHTLTVIVVRFEVELDTSRIHMLNECLVVNEKLFNKVCCLLTVGAIYRNTATEVITRLFAIPDEAVQMLLYGFFLGVGIAEVDFISEPLTRGKVFHEREISVPV